MDQTTKLGRMTLAFLIGTALLSAMGLTVIGPVVPFLVQPYIADPSALASVVGWLTSIYAVCQFVAAPGLGLLSDRYGRRPILLICLAGSVAGYVLFGLGGALWVLFLGRVIDGLTGGNFGVMSAAIADVTAPEDRGRIYGILGAVVGIGFIVGPVVGGLAARISYQAPAWIAAGLTLANMLWGLVAMPETLRRSEPVPPLRLAALNPLAQLRDLFALPRLRGLLLVGILYTVPFAVLQSNLGVLVIDSLHWQPDQLGFSFLIVGGMDVLVQGLLVGRLLPIFREVKLMVAGLVCQVVSYVLLGSIALTGSPAALLGGLALFAFGSGLIVPSLAGLTSQAASAEQQGIVAGGGQALQALVRVLAPVLGGLLYVQAGPAAPYWLGAFILALAVVPVLLAAPLVAERASPAAPVS